MQKRKNLNKSRIMNKNKKIIKKYIRKIKSKKSYKNVQER